ncbi:MAG: MFS transporter [Armatimonadetes bacterium]|nr:MFS transporter [Armatimonadota bacterium]
MRLRRAFSAEYRDFWLIVANGVLVRLYFEVFSPKRVVAAFLTELTHREWMVGLALAAPTVFSCLPMLFFSHRMETEPRRMPFYARGARIKWVSQFALLFAVVMLPRYPMVLALFFVAMCGLFGLGDAMGGPAFGDVVARTIVPHRRGRMFGLRVALGGVLAFFVGGLISRCLDPRLGLPFPNNYLLLFGTAFAFLVAAQFCFMRVDEPPLESVPEQTQPLADYLRSALVVLRSDVNVRRFCIYRNLSPLGWVPAAFIIPYALGRLHFPPSVVGTIVSTSVVASSVSNLFWGSLGDKRGNSLVLRYSSLFLLLAAASLAVTPLLVGQVTQGTLLTWLVASNAIGEVGLVGMMNGQLNYLYDLAPDDQVPLYVGTVATAAAPMLIFAPLLIGWAAGRFDYIVIFTFGLVFSLAVWISTFGLGEPRPQQLRQRRKT